MKIKPMFISSLFSWRLIDTDQPNVFVDFIDLLHH